MEAAITPPETDLTVVVPVYNEEAAIAGVLASSAVDLERLGIDYRFAVYDDGSRGGTPRILGDPAERYHAFRSCATPTTDTGPPSCAATARR